MNWIKRLLSKRECKQCAIHNVSVSSLIELMNIHLEPREELNHVNNAIDIYIDGQRDLAEEIIKLINTNSR